MPTEMPLDLPFVVDTWGPSRRRRRHRFLTHAHCDHLESVEANPGDTVYTTSFTMRLALLRFSQLERGEFVEMEVGKRQVVDDSAGAFSVTAYDANHCPGAVMFLFEGPFGSILHTGDCRLTSDCLRNLPLNSCRLDTVYLDCTFSKFPMFPSKESSIQQVIACISKHPHAPFVYLGCERLGHEEILVEVSRTFGSKIYVDKGLNLDYYNALSRTVREIIIDDPTCRFQKMLQDPFQNQENISDELTEPNLRYKLDYMDAVFVPLLMRKTWYLVVANFWKKRFEVLSPLGYTDELIRQAQSAVCNFQEAFDTAYPRSKRVKIKEMDSTFHTISNSDNESDSGIFIMKSLDLYDGENQIFFNNSDAKGLREQLTLYLLDHKYNRSRVGCNRLIVNSDCMEVI